GQNTLKAKVQDTANNWLEVTRIFNISLVSIEQPPPTPLKIGLEIVSGNNQEGLIGKCAKDPLIVRAYNANTGVSLEGISLIFEATQVPGTFVEDTTYSTLTNIDGKSALHYHYSRTPGINQVKVGVSGDDSVTPVIFDNLEGYLPQITLQEPLPLEISTMFGALKDVLKVKVIDPRKGTGLKNVKVKTRVWLLTGGPRPPGGGEEQPVEASEGTVIVSPSRQLTDANGEAVFGFAWLMTNVDGYIEFYLPEFIDPTTSQPLKKNSSHIGLPPMLNQYLWIPIVDNGQAQIGTVSQKLNKPLKVYVYKTDAFGNLIPTQVTFTVKVGGGTIVGMNPQMTVDGYAQIEYSLGDKTTLQIIEVASEGERIYFAVGIPEVILIKETSPGSGVFTPTDYIDTIGVLQGDGTIVASVDADKEFRVEYKYANIQNPPNSLILMLEGRDEKGTTVSSGVAFGSRQIVVYKTLSQPEPERYVLYRSDPIIYTDSRIERADGVIIDPISKLSSGQELIQGKVGGYILGSDELVVIGSHKDKSNGCGLRLFLDDGYVTELIDWPATTTQKRSPKFSFITDYPVRIEVIDPGANGNKMVEDILEAISDTDGTVDIFELAQVINEEILDVMEVGLKGYHKKVMIDRREIGVEWQSKYGDYTDETWIGTLNYAGDFVIKLYHQFFVSGYEKTFSWGDLNSKKEHWVGTNDTNHIDSVDMVAWCGHGTRESEVTAGNIWLRFFVDKIPEQLEPTEKLTPSELSLGETDLEWVVFNTCRFLSDSAIPIFQANMKGAHLILGWKTEMTVYTDAGKIFAENVLKEIDNDTGKRYSIVKAWFKHALDIQPSDNIARIIGPTYVEFEKVPKYYTDEIFPDPTDKAIFKVWDSK
ncbi:MAG: hypothetical protein HY762_04925, partial [Planctomycetes bacterium]|nr:hypothetical protein [Planctomycetota bacterium]